MKCFTRVFRSFETLGVTDLYRYRYRSGKNEKTPQIPDVIPDPGVSTFQIRKKGGHLGDIAKKMNEVEKTHEIGEIISS